MGTFSAQSLVKGTFLWVFLAGAWVAGCDPEPPSGTCGIPPSTNDECAVLTCAAQDECSSVDEAVDCCFEQFGYGLEDDYLPKLLEDCSGEDCNPANYISSKTALCITQVHGLESGVGWCGGAFINHNPDFYWSIINTIEEIECTEESAIGHKSGYEITLDAKTGERVDSGTTEIHGTIDCSGY